MIIIISRCADHSTNDVAKWLIKNNVKFSRLGEEQFINNISIIVSNNSIQIELKAGGLTFSLNDIKSFWYRKHKLELLNNIPISFNSVDYLNDAPILPEYLEDSIDSVRKFIIHELEKKNHIGNIGVGNGNKLISFSLAKVAGLKIPATYVSSNLEFLKGKTKEQKLIAKPVDDAFASLYTNQGIKTNYDLAKKELFVDKASDIFPSSLQEYIEKKLELRVFYLREKMETIAIFSQNDEQTKIDFRNYNEENPNRMVPYSLPQIIEKKIITFMRSIDLRSGSLDLILTNNNEYVFLEVNPVGQYGMVAEGCNVNLDKRFADELVKI